jgi:hypothetical protein
MEFQDRTGSSRCHYTVSPGIDYDFIPSYDIQILKGRNFSKEFGNRQKMVLLNEAAVDELGFKSTDDAIGGKLAMGYSDRNRSGEEFSPGS